MNLSKLLDLNIEENKETRRGTNDTSKTIMELLSTMNTDESNIKQSK